MDLNSLGMVSFNWDFIFSLSSIVLIDIVLAGDNAVVIAMAVKSLSPKQRSRGIMIGAAAAVAIRIVLTFFAAKLLAVSFVKLFGGILIAWIAVKLFLDGAPEDKFRREVKTLGQAVVTIMIADLVMSTDNILAVAGASKGNLSLLLFGLGLSIPFVVFASNLLSKLMDRFSLITYVGAAILGKVAGEMIMTDPFVVRMFHDPGHLLAYTAQGVCAVGVIGVAKVWLRFRKTEEQAELAYQRNDSPFYLAGWDIR